MAKRKKRCLVCPNLEQTRGLCTDDRKVASELIRREITTDDELVELGLMSPKKPMGRPRAKRRGKGQPTAAIEQSALYLALQERLALK
jgi:hypothetical protein